MDIDKKIRKIPNWPKPGVLFYDITTLFEDKEAFKFIIEELCWPYKDKKIDKVVGIDARGFLLASTMAYKLGAGISMARKKGKLPHKTVSKDYDLEYGSNTIEMHADTIKPGEKIIIVDDLVATGGTIKAVVDLIRELKGEVVGVSWIVDLPFLGGSAKIKNYNCNYLIKYENEKIEEKKDSIASITKPVKIGIIGGSGLENLDILEEKIQEKVFTPFGAPSDIVTIGHVKKNNNEKIGVVIIPRHGHFHHLTPTEVNYRANIWALKELGVTHIIATSACGSLKEEYKPGEFVLINQFIDRTTKRHQTFYQGRVCHIPMADPMCLHIRNVICNCAHQLGVPIHKKGTVVTIEGPRFSTKAESNIFRSWNADIINMTTVPEVVLAREAGICYQAIAMITDYDCWREDEEGVDIEQIIKTMDINAEKMEALLKEVILRIEHTNCKCNQDIKRAII